jgi:DeoR family transcriptional regulator of aga operon
VVADSSKVGKVAFARICGLDCVHDLITDAAADPALLAPVAEAGVEITLV